jgi:hypothetical protein
MASLHSHTQQSGCHVDIRVDTTTKLCGFRKSSDGKSANETLDKALKIVNMYRQLCEMRSSGIVNEATSDGKGTRLEADFDLHALPLVTLDHMYNHHIDIPDTSQTGMEEPPHCNVCYSSFSDADTEKVIMMSCFHDVVCSDCWQQYVRVRVKDKDVMPWIPCA